VCVCYDLSDRVVILAAVKYLHNNCSRIAFRSQIKSSWARAYVIEATQHHKTTTTTTTTTTTMK